MENTLLVKNSENPLLKDPKAYGLKKKTSWHNNNRTIVVENIYVVDLEDLSNQPIKIIKDLFNYKLECKDETFVLIPVAGWTTKKPNVLSQIFSIKGKEERLLEEYTKSFSLSPFITVTKDTSLVLRVSKEAQKMKIIKDGDQDYFEVTAGVRITDGDQFLFKKGFALLPNMSTIHVVSFIGGQGTGIYGPTKNYSSMTTDIVSMKIINAYGTKMTLSSKENPHLFEVLRDCHLGACLVRKITMKIEPKFLMKRDDMLFKDVNELKEHMIKDNLIDKEHFIAMYIPVDIGSQGEHASRIRITNCERFNGKPPKKMETQEHKDFCDYFNLKLTETGEPLIDLITKSPKLREFFPFVLKAGALKTYGTEKTSSKINYSAPTLHILGTYTSLPIFDINWLIHVENVEDARELLLNLLELSEKLLIEYAKDHEYPIFNAFSRYIKGIWYPEGKGGIAPTGVEKENQSILSFEFVTYMPLTETKAFKSLLNAVVEYLENNNRKYNYHPGKSMPDNIHSLEQIFTDPVRKQRLKNFKKAVYELHGGKQNIPYSPFLTPQKKEFIGFKTPNIEELEEKISIVSHSKEQVIESNYHNINEDEEQSLTSLEKKALKAILKLAKEDEVQHKDIIEKANQHLEKK